MEGLTNWMQEHIAPLATRLGQNKFIQAISGGMMHTMPLTLGVALIAILINLPIPGVSDFLASSGLTAAGNEVIGATMSLLAIYVSFLIAYQYAKDDGMNPLTAGVLSMGSFLILVPSTIDMGEAGTITAFKSNYLGSDGIFVAIFLSILVAMAYGWLTRKNIKVTLPDSVPPMVADSLSPVFTAMIIFLVVYLVKWGFTFTPWGNIFDFIMQNVGTPLMKLGATPWSVIIVYTVGNIFWFFGIHPNAVMGIFYPMMLLPALMANQQAYLNGEPLPFLMFALIGSCCYFGGQGNTIGLCFDMFTAKSEKFKAMRNLMTIPNIFNINEPVIFGVPVMLNPVFFIPMVLSSIVPGLIGLVLCTILPIPYNPTIQLPWAMPMFIAALLTGGPLYMGVVLICMAVSAVLYYPFFKIADKQAYEEEQALAAEQAQQ